MDPVTMANLSLPALVLLALASSVRTVPAGKAGIVERRGRYYQTLNAGISFLVPFVDRLRLVDLGEKIVKIRHEQAIAADHRVVAFDIALYLSVVDPKAATYETDNYREAITLQTVKTMREIVGVLNLEHDDAGLRTIDELLRARIDEAANRWGVRVNRVAVTAIDDPVSAARSDELDRDKDQQVTDGGAGIGVPGSSPTRTTKSFRALFAVVVPTGQVGIVDRLGRYRRTLDPGRRLVLPFIDRVRLLDMGEQEMRIPTEVVFTADHVAISFDGVLSCSVTDPKAATYEILDYRDGIEFLALNRLRHLVLVEEMDFERVTVSRRSISSRLAKILQEDVGRWGIRIHRVEVHGISPITHPERS